MEKELACGFSIARIQQGIDALEKFLRDFQHRRLPSVSARKPGSLGRREV
jgi:hypothetical protein